MLEPGWETQVAALAEALTRRRWKMAAAESCTGGLIAAACTSRAGSSDWFERGFVTYSNEAKTALLGVPPAVLMQSGAVSDWTVRAMAQGAVTQAPVQLGVAVTGIAGPGGAVPGKPVGTVWVAVARRVLPDAAVEVRARLLGLAGDRAAVRAQTVTAALALVIECANTGPEGHWS